MPHFESGPQPRQVVPVGEFLDQQSRQRRGRFTDGKAWVAAAVDEGDTHAALAEDECEGRPGESRSDDGDVGLDAADRDEGHDGVTCPQTPQVSGGGVRCVRLAWVRRACLASRQHGQVAKFWRSHVSTKMRATPVLACVIAPAAARSIASRLGGVKRPSAASASIAPLPARVGIKVTAVAPHSSATATEWCQPGGLFGRGHEGGIDEQEHAQVNVVRGQVAGGPGKRLHRDPLVQLLERRGMHGFQSHGHFQAHPLT